MKSTSDRHTREPRARQAKTTPSGSLARILVPLDGTVLSEGILKVVSRLVAGTGIEVMLVNVLDSEETTRPGDNLVEVACDYLEALRCTLADAGTSARYSVAAGDPAEKILALGEEYEPSLIAMATHGRTGFDRWLRGSVTESVLRGSRFPVLAASSFGLRESEGRNELPPRRILVPLDGSERAASVLPLVGDLARLTKASVTLLHALEPSVLAAPLAVALLPAETETEGVALLEPSRRLLEDGGVAASTRVVIGTATSAILGLAGEQESDLIALTTHGRSGLSRLVFGSVAEEVLRRAPCPILVKRTAGP